jgi:hypothetical protein
MSLRRQTPGRIAKRQERAVAKRLGGTRQRGSGAVSMRRGDVVHARWMGEVKWTAARSYRLTLDVLDKIERDAAATGRSPYLLIEFRPQGTQQPGTGWVMVPVWVAETMAWFANDRNSR